MADLLRLKVQDLLTGKKVSSYYSLYQYTQWFSEDEMRSFQLGKLQQLIRHCYEHVPFYRKYMQAEHIHPSDICSLDNLHWFPVINKQVIKENLVDFTPDNLRSIMGVKQGCTGGTTGEPLQKRNDSKTRSSIWGSFARFHDWMGISDRDKKVDLMSSYNKHSKLVKRLADSLLFKLNNTVVIDTYEEFEANLSLLRKILSGGSIRLIRSYTQYLFTLASEYQRRNESFRVKAITTTAEPLYQEHRKLFEQVFNCQVFDQYGCGEIGGIAYECDHHKGLHVTEERVIVEMNSKKELIITDLDNYSMPFIRYWNADEADISDQKCSCGRQSLLLRSIRGRITDYLVGPEGQKMHCSIVLHNLMSTGIALRRNMKKFQVRQVSRDHLLFRIVSDQLDNTEKKVLRDNLREKLGDIEVDFIQEIDIENSPSGKFRPVVNELLL